jgi:hypothetical protein
MFCFFDMVYAVTLLSTSDSQLSRLEVLGVLLQASPSAVAL